MAHFGDMPLLHAVGDMRCVLRVDLFFLTQYPFARDHQNFFCVELTNKYSVKLAGCKFYSLHTQKVKSDDLPPAVRLRTGVVTFRHSFVTVTH
jgi:hypothetical protein